MSTHQNSIERQHTNARMSKIVKYGGLVYLCGQTANGSASAEADITAQTHEVLSRIDALLAEAGSQRDRILSTTIYLRDIADFGAMNAVWDAWVPAGTAPARTTLEARLGASSLLVEMTVVAAQ
ncbi:MULTISPECIES: RidA family protein [Herbaspirillum]|uniref:RidA family protein n=2 Tax=Herbaspirillum rubrisubalbicans TaxID=80842 RepID=A0A6M3ZYB3_9BURK|nr:MULTISPECIES: RidA family protein [Herbaspirillum]MCP1574966.1 enamine deaminase RidA (YjgF/YER057c/UK114 family) [Herbaspirillum rubrisubalbicans]QJQ03486.1 RidA family protein [Herbaspirillum rubrisubalbicans Os34]